MLAQSKCLRIGRFLLCRPMASHVKSLWSPAPLAIASHSLWSTSSKYNSHCAFVAEEAIALHKPRLTLTSIPFRLNATISDAITKSGESSNKRCIWIPPLACRVIPTRETTLRMNRQTRWGGEVVFHTPLSQPTAGVSSRLAMSFWSVVIGSFRCRFRCR